MEIVDHHGERVRHGRATVNGVRLHYLTAGEGEPVLLLHGVPKTSYHWRHVIPLLTPHHRVVVPDMGLYLMNALSVFMMKVRCPFWVRML